MNRIALAAAAFLAVSLSPRGAAAQDQYVGTQGPAPVAVPSLTAEFVDADRKALAKSATVVVDVKNLALVDPDSTHGTPRPGQGHIHYRLDDGPTIASTATKLSFHGLTAGTHVLTISLAANDHSPLGPSVALRVTIP